MEGILKFKLPEEKQEFDLAANAGAYHSALYSFGENLRSRWKHGNPDKKAYEEHQQILKLWYEHVSDLRLD
mgnify:CR=1 FL=1